MIAALFTALFVAGFLILPLSACWTSVCYLSGARVAPVYNRALAGASFAFLASRLWDIMSQAWASWPHS